MASSVGVAAGAAGHQIARRHPPVADAAGDRSPELGEFEIELGLAHQRLVRRHRGLGIAERLRPLLEDLLADGPVAQELPAARQVGLREYHIGSSRLQIRARLVERVLERPLVDGEQQVALLHDLAVLEMHLVEIAGHPRAHLDRHRPRRSGRHIRPDRRWCAWRAFATVTFGGGGPACFCALAAARKGGGQGDQHGEPGACCSRTCRAKDRGEYGMRFGGKVMTDAGNIEAGSLPRMTVARL